ncbi:NADH-ubiquinone oxidoreductase chain E [hydrothermal vent metagenome]|uniref:NADH-ubiquinone oxidoreductase chain E n=1 Tax=hydrothermal vent metagenome TaxID=652676 RepID=A0A1W1BXD5_9ZZZZ
MSIDSKSFAFSAENISKIEELKGRYPSPKALTLPCLWMVQYQEGYISLEAIEEISKYIDTPPMEIYRVATFYTMFNLEPVGRYHIQLCKTLSCQLCGSMDILKRVIEKLGIGVGESSGDGRYTVSQVECLGSCGTAPVMQINDIYYENLTPSSVDEIIDGLEGSRQ